MCYRIVSCALYFMSFPVRRGRSIRYPRRHLGRWGNLGNSKGKTRHRMLLRPPAVAPRPFGRARPQPTSRHLRSVWRPRLHRHSKDGAVYRSRSSCRYESPPQKTAFVAYLRCLRMQTRLNSCVGSTERLPVATRHLAPIGHDRSNVPPPTTT